MSGIDYQGRPVSPHATIYRWPLNSLLSILHRITGAGLTIGAVLIVWWLCAAATSNAYFQFVDGLLTSLLGDLILLGCLAALWYHGCNGIRHLIWDAGRGFDSATVKLTGWLSIAAAAVLVIGTVLVV